jgi:hypothetical protein
MNVPSCWNIWRNCPPYDTANSIPIPRFMPLRFNFSQSAERARLISHQWILLHARVWSTTSLSVFVTLLLQSHPSKQLSMVFMPNSCTLLRLWFTVLSYPCFVVPFIPAELGAVRRPLYIKSLNMTDIHHDQPSQAMRDRVAKNKKEKVGLSKYDYDTFFAVLYCNHIILSMPHSVLYSISNVIVLYAICINI